GLGGDLAETLGDGGTADEAGLAQPFAEGLLNQIRATGAIEDEGGLCPRLCTVGYSRDGGEPSDTQIERGAPRAPDRHGPMQLGGDGERRHRRIQIAHDDGFRRRPPCHPSVPRATAVPLLGLEKPHSLSYQESTRTKLPSITWVCFRSKTELAGL